MNTKNKLKDVSTKEFTGSFGNDRCRGIDLGETNNYRILIRDYFDDNETERLAIDVDIKEVRLINGVQWIKTSRSKYGTWFYYNGGEGCFKNYDDAFNGENYIEEPEIEQVSDFIINQPRKGNYL